MSGENYKNPLLIKSDGSLTVSDVTVVDRDTVTFNVSVSADASRSGHSLEYLSRPNDDKSTYDGSSVTIQNNVIVVPAAPSLDSPSPEISGLSDSQYDFHEVGQGDPLSEHPTGKVQPITGQNFFDMQDIENELEGGADLVSCGIQGAGDAGAPESDNLRCRFGTWDSGAQEWTDHPAVIVSRQADISASELTFNVTLSIEGTLQLGDFEDTLSLDCLIETRSGGLPDGADQDNLSPVCLGPEEGQMAIIEDYITVRRAKVHEIVSLTEVAAGAIDVQAVQGGDDTSLVAALANGTEVAGNEVELADIDFRQAQTKWFVVEASSPFALPDCIDSSITVERDVANTQTSPQAGVLNVANRLDPHSGFSTTASGDDQLFVLSDTQFLMQLVSRTDQELGQYAFRAKTLSNGSVQSDALFTIDLAAAEFVLTGFDVLAIAPDAIVLQGGARGVQVTGSGMPDGFAVPGHPNENGAIEGSMEVVYIQTADAHTVDGSQQRFSLDPQDLKVISDTEATLTVQADNDDLRQWISDGGEADQTLGFYDVRLRTTDANGNSQEKDLNATLRVMNLWPPEFVGAQTGSNYVREGSLNGAFSTEDQVDFSLLRLRGSHDANSPNVNGVSAYYEYGEHEFELIMKVGDSGDNAADYAVVSTEDASQLLTATDAAGTDKPFLLIKRIEAQAGNGVQNDSDQVEHRIYEWRIVLECVSEEALEKGLHTPNGLDDLVRDAGYYGAGDEPDMLGVRIRTKDYEESGDMTDWEYFGDIFEVLPANIEIDALGAAQPAAEIARSSSAAVSMAGDNLYPSGSGEATQGAADSGIPGASGSGQTSGGGQSSGGNQSSGGGGNQASYAQIAAGLSVSATTEAGGGSHANVVDMSGTLVGDIMGANAYQFVIVENGQPGSDASAIQFSDSDVMDLGAGIVQIQDAGMMITNFGWTTVDIYAVSQ